MSVDLNNAYSGRGASSRQSTKNDDAFDDFFKNSLRSQASLGQPELALDDGGQQDKARDENAKRGAKSGLPLLPKIPSPAPVRMRRRTAAALKKFRCPLNLIFKSANGETVHLKSSWAKSTGILYIYNPQKSTYDPSPSFSGAVYTGPDGSPYVLNKSPYDLHYDGFVSFEFDPKAPKGAETQIRSIASKIQVINLTTGKVLVAGQPAPQNVAQAAPEPTTWQNFKTWVDELAGPAYPDGVTERMMRANNMAPNSARYRGARMLQGVVDIPRVVEIPWHITGYLGGVDTSDPDVRAMLLMSACPAGASDACHEYLLYDMASQALWNKTSGGVPHPLSREFSVNNFMGDVPIFVMTLPFMGMQTANKVIATEEAFQAQQAAKLAPATSNVVNITSKMPKPPSTPPSEPPSPALAMPRIRTIYTDAVGKLKIAARNITGKISDAVVPPRQPELATPNGVPSLGRSPLDKINDGMQARGPSQPMNPMKIDEIYDTVSGSGVRNLQGKTAQELANMNIGFLKRNFETDLAMLKRLRFTTNLPDKTAEAMGMDNIKAMVPAIESKIKQLIALAGDIKSGAASATAYEELAAGLGQVNAEMQNLEAAVKRWEAVLQYAQQHGMLAQPGSAASAESKVVTEIPAAKPTVTKAPAAEPPVKGTNGAGESVPSAKPAGATDPADAPDLWRTFARTDEAPQALEDARAPSTAQVREAAPAAKDPGAPYSASEAPPRNEPVVQQIPYKEFHATLP